MHMFYDEISMRRKAGSAEFPRFRLLAAILCLSADYALKVFVTVV